MSAVNMIFYLGGPYLGEVEAGFVAGITTAPFSVIIGGIGAAIATAVIVFFEPKLQRYQGNEYLS
jgi:hypothetical protein